MLALLSFLVNFGIMVHKGDDYLKRIVLFTLALLFTFTTIGFAQKGITYEVDDFFWLHFLRLGMWKREIIRLT